MEKIKKKTGPKPRNTDKWIKALLEIHKNLCNKEKYDKFLKDNENKEIFSDWEIKRLNSQADVYQRDLPFLFTPFTVLNKKHEGTITEFINTEKLIKL